jgi:hypothetical protein
MNPILYPIASRKIRDSNVRHYASLEPVAGTLKTDKTPGFSTYWNSSDIKEGGKK